ncbi:MAG: PqqD family protein [Hyphomicrobiales bacterium]|nr:PqqD family protein [Hyphomicrobiales bacterium]MCP4997854.1 PqqD family protein [Hyphomicrobiales bacterium]
MSSNSDLFLKQSTRFYEVEVDGAKLLYRPTGQKALHLDQAATVVWQLCDGTRTAEAVVEEVASLYPEERETVARDVRETIEMLRGHGVIVTAKPEE